MIYLNSKVIRILFISIGIAALSCNDDCIEGTGANVTRELGIETFDAIETGGSFDVNISQGIDLKVEAIGNSNIIDRLDTTVVDGLWRCELQSGCYRDFTLEIFVTVPELTSITTTGSGDLILSGFNSTVDLEILSTGSGNIIQNGTAEISTTTSVTNTGSGEITMDIESPDLQTTLAGSGDITLTGFVNNLDLRNDGSGNFQGFGLMADTCFVTSTSSGNCNISVSAVLNATLTGSGNVTYRGMPEISSTITGSGDLIDGN